MQNLLLELTEHLKKDRRFVAEGKLPKNYLYVNYTEIKDKDHKIFEDDKKLNKIFYSRK